MTEPESGLMPPAPAFRERWLDFAAAILLAAAAGLTICLIAWPGFMSFDSLYAYRQSIEGVETAMWPPMHDYLFFIFRQFPGSPGNFLFFQCFALFFSSNLIIRHFSPSPAVSIPLMGLFFGVFFLFPAMAGTLIALWKDTAVATFAIMAVALWLACARRFSWLKLVLIFLSLTVAVALRYNAITLIVPLLLLIMIQPGVNATKIRHRAGVGAGIICMMLLAYSSTLWRLPDFRRLPPVDGLVTLIQLWDIAGMSVCANENLLPPEAGSKDGPWTAEALSKVYDPRHVNLSFEKPEWSERIIFSYTPEERQAVNRRWQELLKGHTGCYLQTRFNVFREQMGLGTDTVFYPTHGGIDENPYGFKPRYPERAHALVQMILEGSKHPLRRAYVLLTISILVLLPLIWLDRRRAAFPVMLAAGSILSAGLLAFAAPAADARYTFPSGVFSALVIMIALARFSTRLRRGKSSQERNAA
jgi:hypothetical protein